MTTGDLKNNLRKLVSELKQIHYPQSELDIKGVAQGVPKAFLPIVHHVFLDYSISLAQYFASKEYELYGKTDLRFMEAVYKVLRDEFGYKPQLTREQFLTIGFAERKIILICAILKLLREKHDKLNPIKGGKSEKKKGKQSWPNSQLNDDRTNECLSKCKVISTSSDYFPGPLPVDTDMKRFRSNEEAMNAGLGLKEPLVTRMFVDSDPIGTGSHEMPLNSGPSAKATTDDSVPSNLIIKTTSDQRLFGVKFPVSQNSEIQSNLSRQPQVKSVTWEDQLKESQNRQSEQGGKVSCALPLSNGTMNPISVPARIHSIPYSRISPAYYPIQSENTSIIGMIPHTIPSPVSMTTVPMPSPDLMLTPTVKNSNHEAVPLSSSHNVKDLQGASLNSDGKLPSTRVVRHSNPVEGDTSDFCVTKSSSSAEAQVYVLKQYVQELQEKFDSMVLLNNEMSARVVLLESKMKLLEESCENNQCCCNCRGPLPTMYKENASKQIVVSGFNVQGEKDSAEPSPVNSPACVSTKFNGEISNSYYDSTHKSVLKGSSTSRELFKETTTSLASGHVHVVKDFSCADVSPAHSEKSDVDDDDSDGAGFLMNAEETAGKSKSASSSEQDENIIMSPFPSISKISGVFADSSTKNAVVNVHKRLQETRELLARTNRDFAAKFNHYQIE